MCYSLSSPNNLFKFYSIGRIHILHYRNMCKVILPAIVWGRWQSTLATVISSSDTAATSRASAVSHYNNLWTVGRLIWTSPHNTSHGRRIGLRNFWGNFRHLHCFLSCTKDYFLAYSLLFLRIHIHSHDYTNPLEFKNAYRSYLNNS